MKTFVSLAAAAVLVVGCATVRAEDPAPPAPSKEHLWLKQLEGSWECESEGVVAPGQPPVKCKGKETVRSLGGLWLVGEMNAEFMGTPVTGVMTVGYDAKKKKFVGTWVCSMSDFMNQYEGTLDGNTLTLNTEGPHMVTGKMVKMKDVVELKDKDTRVLTSSMQGDDGKWVTFMTMTAKRKK